MKKLVYILILMLPLCLTGCKKNVNVTINYLDQVKTISIKQGTTVANLFAEDIEDYQLDGVYYDADETRECLLNTKITADITLYAKYTQNVFNVTIINFDEENTIKVPLGEQIYSYMEFEKEGYDFKGLYYDSKYTNKYDMSSVVLDNLTLYASYTTIKYQVSFETFGGTTYKAVSVEQGGKIVCPNNIPYKLGYEFIGWYADENLTIPYDFNNFINSDIIIYAGYQEVSYDGIIDEYLPDEISSSIELPSTADGLEFYWYSSDEYTMDGLGNVRAGRNEITITMRLDIYPKGLMDHVTYEKEVTILPYELRELEIGNVVIGYSSSWNYKTYSADTLKTVDIYDLSFAYVNDNGTLDLSSISYTLGKAVSEAHAVGTRVCLSIQGYGTNTKNFSDCAADSILRSNLAHSMAQVVSEYHLDGIDIDWEYPGSSDRTLAADRTNYTLLMAEIRNELDKLGTGYLLTAAIPGGPWGADRFEMAKLADYFDFFNMMSYDCENPNTGSHHAALYPSNITGGTYSGCSISETLALWLSQGVPANKICLGIAFYGKRMMVKTATNGGLGQLPFGSTSKYATITYAKLMNNYLSRIGITVNYYYDEVSCAPYLLDTQGNMFSTYDNEASVIAKCEYAKENSLGGVMIWELGEDDTDTLIKAVYQGMNKKSYAENIYICTGQISVNINDVITLKAINEVLNSSLYDSVIFVCDDEGIMINNNIISFEKTGIYQVKCMNSSTNIVYTTISINVN